MLSITNILTFLAAASCAIAVPAPQAASDDVGIMDPEVSSFAGSTYADGTYKRTVLTHHNVHRANHSSPNIAWAANLEKWAAQVAKGCVWQHNTSVGTESYGQNIAAGTPRTGISSIITDQFYNGEVNNFLPSYYGKDNPDMSNFENWGHFSQVVWAGSKKVACATQDCTKMGGIKGLPSNFPPYFTVCNYYPAGNVGGAYGSNIGKPKKGAKSVGANY